jgi:hypothetical protein
LQKNGVRYTLALNSGGFPKRAGSRAFYLGLATNTGSHQKFGGGFVKFDPSPKLYFLWYGMKRFKVFKAVKPRNYLIDIDKIIFLFD